MARRTKNEGTIYWSNTHNLWVAQITLPNGKRKSKYSKDQKTVRNWLLEQRKALKDGSLVSESITVSEFFKRYLDVIVHTVRPKTYERYEGLYRLHIEPELGYLKLHYLRPAHIQGLYSTKLSDGQSKRSVQQLHALIHKALDQALKWGLVNQNVSDLVTSPKPDKRIPPTLTKDQVIKFLGVAKKDRLYALYVLAITTGMRQGELLGLRWGDVDLDKALIQVKHTTQTLWKKGIVFTEPKTEKSKRSITIPEIAVEALKNHPKIESEHDLVFPTSEGTPIRGGNLLKYFKRLLERAGLPQMRFHDLRHTSATLLLTAGVHPKIVQERLGHSQIGLTLDTYSHVLPSMQEEAANKMDNMLTNGN